MIQTIDIIFPNLCLHCLHPIEQSGLLFCPACVPFFEMLDPKDRCHFCFKEGLAARCQECLERGSFAKSAVVFERAPQVTTLASRIFHGRRYYLLKTAVSFLAIQFTKLNWELPDLITAAPQGRLGPLLIKQKPLSRLTTHFAEMFNIESKQALLMFWETFYLACDVKGKRILVIEEEMTKNEEHLLPLQKGGAKEIYRLSLSADFFSGSDAYKTDNRNAFVDA